MKQISKYINSWLILPLSLVILVLLNICLLLGAIYKYEEPVTLSVSSDKYFTYSKDDDIWFSIPFYKEDPKPGQILTWDGKKFKWLYLKEIQEKP